MSDRSERRSFLKPIEMNNKEQAKRIVDGVKERLRTETDPEQRRGLAIIGEEFNLLHMQLSGHDPQGKVRIRKRVRDIWIGKKKCTKCREEKDLKEFGPVKQYYQNKKGEMISYSYSRAMCNCCTWPNAESKRDNDFIVGGIRIY